MKNKTFSVRNFKNYISVFKGVKMPWFFMTCALCSAIVMMDSEITIATLTADIIDSSQKAIDSTVLIQYISAAFVAAAATIAEIYFERKTEELVSLRIRTKLWDKIIRLPLKYYDVDNGNELVTRVTSDAEAPSSLITTAISCITCVVTTVSAFEQLFEYNALLAKYSLLIIPLTLIVSVLFGIFQFKLGVYSTVTMAGSLGYIAERVRNFKLIKSAVAEKAELLRGKKTFKNMYKADFLSWLVVAGYQLASNMFSIMFIIIVFVGGALLIKSEAVTIGELVAFYSITGIVSLQLMQLFMNAGSLSGTFGTMKKISEIMKTPTENYEGEALPVDGGDIVFDNVSFSYDGEHDAIKNLSLTIPKGKVTAIIGGNGAGKSTVFKLITRLYEPTSGEISFSGKNASCYSLEEWRDMFSYVSQKTALIGGTVKDNLTYGLSRDVSDEKLLLAAKRADCYNCIKEKPQGLLADVGSGGSDFSGGQAQCISIARAILRDAPVVLLDEATSNLDVLSEAGVTNALGELTKNKTTLMIAHSFAATKYADFIAVMKDGSLEAFGTPEELIKTNEYYKLFSKSEKETAEK